ncbi:AIM24 family protein [Peribacillus muralis]|uniref:AIM24 family protein n=1 Tax=Peribacillus muralis TaxID=264697 RepID=UPI001F4E5446|nr:AIM24 family protein [Peribacillus muralis]MCK1991168.1 AIM24 family protein [Peribacillus muralis]MCK2011722.1 AIM24 family protein [Peribacillus muralis]
MEKYQIDQFVEKTKQQDKGQGLFELETERILEINLEQQIWAKMGTMVSYRGQIKFEREGILEHGLGKLFKKALTGEGASLMKSTGSGKLYVADQGKKISIIQLNGESICVNGNDLLAFEPSIQWDIKMMRRIAGLLAGGLFNVRLEGKGMVAFTSHYEPLTLMVEPGNPVYTDPNATVAWSGELQPEFVTDVSLKSFFGRGSGESVQMKFVGQGFVVVQPFEEVYFGNKES